jgi:hypothetical protein
MKRAAAEALQVRVSAGSAPKRARNADGVPFVASPTTGGITFIVNGPVSCGGVSNATAGGGSV